MDKIKLLTPQMQLLSDRQLEVLLLLGKGKTSHQIGKLLFISAGTVRTHKYDIFKRMGFTNLNELIYYVVRHTFDRGNINFKEEEKRL